MYGLSKIKKTRTNCLSIKADLLNEPTYCNSYIIWVRVISLPNYGKKMRMENLNAIAEQLMHFDDWLAWNVVYFSLKMRFTKLEFGILFD